MSGRSAGTAKPPRRDPRALVRDDTAVDIAQAALEGVCYQLADVLDALGGVESVVATGGALLANPTGRRSSPTCSAEPSRFRRSAKARRAVLQ